MHPALPIFSVLFEFDYKSSLFLTNFPAVQHESQVCYHSATHSPQFDVSFPEKLLKIVATGSGIFSLKFTKYCLAAGLRSDPLGELKCSPRPLSHNKGAYF